MPVSIVSNLSSQYAQSAIRYRNDQVAASTQRLSSGQRVFGAAEDAAALAVGTGLRIENAALNKAKLNATGGVAMLQVADGAMGQVQDILVRLKTLATQASSGNVSDNERALIGQEFAALTTELDRISGDTEFNGVALLAGAARFEYIQPHAISGSGMSAVVKTDTVSADATYRISYDSTTEAVTVSRLDGTVASSQTIDITALLDGVAGIGQNMSGTETVKLHFGTVGLEVTLDASFDRAADMLNTVTDNTNGNITFDTPTFTWNTANVGVNAIDGFGTLGSEYSSVTGDLTVTATSVGGVVTFGGVTGLRYGVDGGAPGASGAASSDLVGAGTIEFYVDNADSGYTYIGRLNLAAMTTSSDDTGTLVVPLGQGLLAADYQDMTAPRQLTYMVGSGVIEGKDLVSVSVPAVTAFALGLESVSVATQGEADVTITALGAALTTIAQARAEVGAQQVRLEQIAAGLATRTENNELAKSALLDADVSEEITNLTNNQAMLEVGISMLSQSNRLPQILLELLRNG